MGTPPFQSLCHERFGGIKMLSRLMKFEFKNIIRDQMTLLLLLYPFMMGGLGRLLLEKTQFDASLVSMMIITFGIISGLIFGAMAGFSIMDDRDDHVFVSIKISPLNIRTYVWFKVGFITALSVVSNFVIYAFIDFNMDLSLYFVLSLLSSLQVPIHAFIINALASNKVEGFMAMKGSGFLLIFPIASFFFLDAKQWLFAFAPAFWVFKAFQYELLKPMMDLNLVSMPLNTLSYVLIGMIYNILLIVILYSRFKDTSL